ncbi:sensor histidine kinase [Microbacterium sp.]|uniref:sensor histidine kinase n=1 Tax=Microbacterium sp. TaxID=51671 RepID=UPI0039E58C9E
MITQHEPVRAGTAPSSSEPAHWGALRERATRPLATAMQYLVLAVVLAALGLSGLWDVFSLLPERVSPWFTLVTAVPACALVLLKRRSPAVGLALVVLVFVADLLTFGGLVPLLVMLELMHAHLVTLDAQRRRHVLSLVLVGTALMTIGAFAFSGELRIAAMIGLQIGALLGVSYWYGNSTAQSRELVSLYRQRAENAERLAELDRAAAVQGERDRMARELHDIVAGHISAVAIRSEAALGRPDAPAGDSPERQALRAVRDSSLEAHGALRSMIQVLRSGDREVAVPPGRARLPELVEAANGSGVRARLVDDVSGGLPAPVDQTVGRIVQEALANSVRHASGSDVEVRLAEDGTTVRVDVVSRGGRRLAAPALPGSGMGLQLLAERARALGGVLTAGSEGPAVWAVRAALPKETAS